MAAHFMLKRHKMDLLLRFIIKDNGAGMEKEDLKHIFEPFYTKKDHGSGLGLSITYGIIEHHKGKITYSSKKGMGTTCQIQLPNDKS